MDNLTFMKPTPAPQSTLEQRPVARSLQIHHKVRGVGPSPLHVVTKRVIVLIMLDSTNFKLSGKDISAIATPMDSLTLMKPLSLLSNKDP